MDSFHKEIHLSEEEEDDAGSDQDQGLRFADFGMSRDALKHYFTKAEVTQLID